jgi:phage terminase Nu1 subunit (DNA packaging protein)
LAKAKTKVKAKVEGKGKAKAGVSLVGAAKRKQAEELEFAKMLDIPRRFYNKLSGRQNNTLQQQADRYGLPLRGERLNLQAICTAFHDLLRDNAHRLAAETGSGDGDMSGPSSKALERYRDERARMVKLQREAYEGTLIQREDVRAGFGMLAERLRQAGEVLQRQYPGAEEILNEALEDCGRVMRKNFGETE